MPNRRLLKEYLRFSPATILFAIASVFIITLWSLVVRPLNLEAEGQVSMQLNLSDVSCKDGKVSPHFVLVHVPEGSFDFPDVIYEINGVTENAVFEKLTGDTAHFRDLVNITDDTLFVTKADIDFLNMLIRLHNPSELDLDCDNTPPPPAKCSDGLDNDGDGKIDSTDPGCSGSDDSDETDIPPTPLGCRLQIEKSVDKEQVTINEVFTFRLNVANTGDRNCSGGGVKIKDVVDNNLAYISETHSGNISAGYGSYPLYSESTGTLWWNGNTLTPGETGWIEWKAKAKASLSCGNHTAKNVGKITSSEYSNYSNWVESNEVGVLIKNDCQEPLVVSCSGIPNTINVGGSVNWTSQVEGGVAPYSYSWSGDFGLSGNNSTSSLRYNLPGTVTAHIAVTDSDRHSASNSCTVSVSATITIPQCPFVAETGRTVINFPLVRKLVSGGTRAQAESSLITTEIIPGKYDIRLFSFDGYVGRENVSQPREQWFLEFIKGTSTIVSSNPIGDLEDNVMTASREELVNTRLSITSASSLLKAVHDGYPEETGSNSVYAVCAALDKIQDEEPETPPVNPLSNPPVTVNPPQGCGNCGSGGGIFPPRVQLIKGTTSAGNYVNVFLSRITYSASGTVAGVYLSQLPYTGIFTDYGSVIIFLLGIGLWSWLVAYAITRDWPKKLRNIMRMANALDKDSVDDGDLSLNYTLESAVRSGIDDGTEIYEEYALSLGEAQEISSEDNIDMANNSSYKNVMNNEYIDARNMEIKEEKLSVGKRDNKIGKVINEAPTEFIKHTLPTLLIREAQKHKVIISDDGFELIMHAGDWKESETMQILEQLIRVADSMYSREAGWLTLGKEEIKNILYPE